MNIERMGSPLKEDAFMPCDDFNQESNPIPPLMLSSFQSGNVSLGPIAISREARSNENVIPNVETVENSSMQFHTQQFGVDAVASDILQPPAWLHSFLFEQVTTLASLINSSSSLPADINFPISDKSGTDSSSALKFAANWFIIIIIYILFNDEIFFFKESM